MADFSSARQSLARLAYGDVQKSIEVHGEKMETFNMDIRKNGAIRNRATVLSSLAGLCTAAGVVGAALGAPQHLFSMQRVPAWNAVRLCIGTMAGGFGLAYVSTSTFAFEREIYELELRREVWEIENHIVGEVQEMLSIYKGQGLTEEEALIVTRIFARDKTVFANLMMVEELGYSRLEPPTTSEAAHHIGVPVLIGFAIGFSTPLIPLFAIVRALRCKDGMGTHNDASPIFMATGSAVAAASGVLGLCNALLSYVQTEVFFGAYAHTPALLRTTFSNAAAIGAVFGLSFLAARWR